MQPSLPWASPGSFRGHLRLEQTRLCSPGGHCGASGLFQPLSAGRHGWHLPQGQPGQICALGPSTGTPSEGPCPARTPEQGSVAHEPEERLREEPPGRGWVRGRPGEPTGQKPALTCVCVCVRHAGLTPAQCLSPNQKQTATGSPMAEGRSLMPDRATEAGGASGQHAAGRARTASSASPHGRETGLPECVCWEGRKVTLREGKDGERPGSEMPGGSRQERPEKTGGRSHRSHHWRTRGPRRPCHAGLRQRAPRSREHIRERRGPSAGVTPLRSSSGDADGTGVGRLATAEARRPGTKASPSGRG